MSAAATAAGYLYASGRLRGRNGREEETHETQPRTAPRRKELKVAVYERSETSQPAQESAGPAPRPKPAPKIQYRTRRWKPE